VEFGRWLQAQMRRRDWSQADLAQQVKASTGAVSMWARGLRKPDPDSCERIADALGLDVDLVLTMAGHRPPSYETDPNDPKELTIQRLRRLKWDRARNVTLAGIIDAWEKEDRREGR
jgi:transcriptional regulator with XRE-family HTH domain